MDEMKTGNKELDKVLLEAKEHMEKIIFKEFDQAKNIDDLKKVLVKFLADHTLWIQALVHNNNELLKHLK